MKEFLCSPDTAGSEGGPEAATELAGSEKAGEWIGRYKLREKIGEGGYGAVYVADQEQPVRRRVAIKVIKLGMDTRNVVARFEAERQALALMDHPNIAKVLDAGATDSGRPFFAMELVRGIKITEYCDQHQVGIEERLALFVKVCQAVQHAHQKGIIHRDLKPSNILVTLHDGVPVPKVIDFGIAKATEGRLSDLTVYTELRQFIGTPAYMSPEQAEMSGLDIDTRSDIYSLGVLLYELLTGKTPFESAELMKQGLDELRRTIREREPIRPSTRVRTMAVAELTTTASRRHTDAPRLVHLLRGDLDWIVMKCLEKDRTRRYETANGLAVDVRRYLRNEPVTARPPSNLYRLQKIVQRHRMAFASASAVVIALVGGIAFSTQQALRARKAELAQISLREAAEKNRERAEQERRRAESAQAQERELRLKAEARAYSSDMNAVQQAWDHGHLLEAQRLLKKHLPVPGERDLRGFEWRYLWNLCHDQSQHTRASRAAERIWTLLPCGEAEFVLGHGPHYVKKLSLATGEELDRFNEPDPQREIWSSAAAGSVPALVATGDTAGRVSLWNFPKKLVLAKIPAFSRTVQHVAVSADGKYIAATDAVERGGGEVKCWRVTAWEAGAVELLWTKGISVFPGFLQFSPDSQSLVTRGRDFKDGSLLAWDTGSGKELASFPKEHSAYIFCSAFSPDGRFLALGSFSRIVVWDFARREVYARFSIEGAGFLALAFSRDGETLVSGGEDTTIRTWNLATRQQEPVKVLRGHRGNVNCVAIAPDGRRILSVGETERGDDQGVETEVKLWDSSPESTTRVIETDQAWSGIAVSPDGRWMVCSHFDPKAPVKVYDLSTRTVRFNIAARSQQMLSPKFSLDGKYFFLGSNDQVLSVWDTSNWATCQDDPAPIVVLTNECETSFCGFTPDKKKVVVTGSSFSPNSTVVSRKIWLAAYEIGSWRPIDFLTKAGSAVTGKCSPSTVDFSPDGKTAAIAYQDGSIRLWDAERDQLLDERKDLQGAWYYAAASFSADGKRLVTFGTDSDRVVVCEVVEQKLRKYAVFRSASDGTLWTAGFDPEGRSVVTAGNDGRIRFWNLAEPSAPEVSLSLRHSEGPGILCLFTTDGNTLVSRDAQGKVVLWPASPLAVR